jgi:hypothetical protein
VIRVRSGVPLVTICAWIKAGENRTTTAKIVTTWRDTLALIVQDTSVEAGRRVNVSDGRDHAKQSCCRHKPSSVQSIGNPLDDSK